MTNPVIRGNSLYTVVDGPSWAEAEANAQKVGGHLASINSASENDFLVGSYPNQPAWYMYWIGLNDAQTEGSYSWSSGEAVTYTNWRPTSGPFRSGSDTSSLGPSYIEFQVNNLNESSAGQWNDTNNTAVHIDGGPGIAETPIVTRGDSAYAIVQGRTWEEAEANAQKLGGHLVTINDTAENNWLYSNVYPSVPDGEGVWLGGTDKGSEGTWRWADGSLWGFSNFSPGQPDNHTVHNPQEGEDYLQFNSWHGSEWNDMSNNYPYAPFKTTVGIAEIKLGSNVDPKATPALTTVAASASDTASALGLEGLNLDVGGAANVQAPVTLKSTSDASTVEGNAKSDAHATEVLGISTSTLHSASDLSIGSALQSMVTGSAESTSGIAIANALVDTQHGIDLTNPTGGDALASGGSSTVISTSTLTATSTAQTIGDGISDSGAQKLDGAWSNTIAQDHLGLGSSAPTGVLTLDSESNATVSTSMLSKLSSTATANDGLAVASSQLLSSTGIENLTAEVGGLGLVTAVNQGVFKADATSTTTDASALGINKASAGILDSTFTFGITDSTITAKDLNSLQISATSTGGDAWSKLQSSSIGLADLIGSHSIKDAGSITAIASDQGFAHSATVSGSSTAFASQEAIGMSGYEVHNHSDLTLSAQSLVSSESSSSSVG